MPTAVEKILSRIEGRPVRAGELLHPIAELVTVHDWYVTHAAKLLEEFGVTKLFNPDLVAFFTDHEPLAVSAASAIRQQAARHAAKRFEVARFHDVGRGGLGHILGVETGLARPGMFASGYDTHITSYGAIGCFATAVVTEVTELLACGSVWMLVPETVEVILTGKLRPGVSARDAAQHLIAIHPPALFDDAAVEFAGPGLASLDMDARLVLVNVPMEVGARTGFISPDAVTLDYCRARGIDATLAATTDLNAQRATVVEVDLSSVVPQVARPPRPDLSGPVAEVADTRFQHAFIGSCAGGMLSDIEEAARILAGRQIAPDVRLYVTPATQGIAIEAARRGLLDALIAAGAIVTAPGCGPCAGGRIAPIAEGEVSLNTGTRNDIGRLGATGDIYLASTATVAVSCLTGRITDPRTALPVAA